MNGYKVAQTITSAKVISSYKDIDEFSILPMYRNNDENFVVCALTFNIIILTPIRYLLFVSAKFNFFKDEFTSPQPEASIFRSHKADVICGKTEG